MPNARFVCLTDRPEEVGLSAVRLQHGWPGWWSKMELFRPDRDTFGDSVIVYVDLDTLLLKPLRLFDYRGSLALLSDLYRPSLAQSGVMIFRQSSFTDEIWQEWLKNAQRDMARVRGDGEWLHDAVGHMTDRVQDVLGRGVVVSLKKHARLGPPPGASIVCGHGIPRLHEQRAGWAHHVWRRLAYGR